jgi:hypothetical protein
VKEETLEPPKIENHQYDNIIAYIDKIYKENFNKFIYFRWIAKSIILVVRKSAKIVGHGKFFRAQAQHTIRYTPITCTTTIDEDLDCTNFVNIFNLINTNVLTHKYGYHKYPKLTHFLFSWFKHRKDKGIPQVGLDCIPLSFWRLGPGKSRVS